MDGDNITDDMGRRMNEETVYDKYIHERANEILFETMNTSWKKSTIAERKLAIYAAEYEVQTKMAETTVRDKVSVDGSLL